MKGTEWPPLQTQEPRCCCGERLTLFQSGSESIDDSPTGINKIIEPLLEKRNA